MAEDNTERQERQIVPHAPWKATSDRKELILIGRYKNMEEEDNIEILYPGQRNGMLQIKIKNEVVYNEVLNRTVGKISCTKKKKADHWEITLKLKVKDGESNWGRPSELPGQQSRP